MPVDDQIMGQDYKSDLLELIHMKSFLYDPDKGFTLSSGVKSDVYIDAKKAVLTSLGMELTGYAFYNELKLEPIDAIGGMTLGADPIAIATGMVCSWQNKFVDVFIVRKEPKKHGTEKWIEGSLPEGSWVAIVDDVVTTGESVIKAIERVRGAGCNVRRAIALVDREEGGKENIESKAKVKFSSIFTKTEIMEYHQKKLKEKEEEEKPKKRDFPLSPGGGGFPGGFPGPSGGTDSPPDYGKMR